MENFFKKVIDVIWKCLKENLWKPLLAFFICDVFLSIPLAFLISITDDVRKDPEISFFGIYLASVIIFSLFFGPLIVSVYSVKKIFNPDF